MLHTLERLSSPSTDTLRVLRRAIDAGEWELCKDLLRFLHSVDGDGRELAAVVRDLGIFDQVDLAGLVKGTTADDSPYVEGEGLAEAVTSADLEPASPSPARPVIRASQQPLSPIADSPRPAAPQTTPSSTSLSGLSSLLFGTSLGSSSPTATTPTGGGGRVFSRPLGGADPSSPSPSPARSSPKPRDGGGRWV